MGKPRKLTAKQAAFVREYLKDSNATEAAKRAGYSAKSAPQLGYQLLQVPSVREALAVKVERIEERAEVDKAEILRELLRLARSDIGQAFNEKGELKPLKDMPEDVRRAICAVETDEILAMRDDGPVSIGKTRKLKLWSKTEALKLLGQHLKLFTEVHEHRLSIADLFDEDEKKAAVQ